MSVRNVQIRAAAENESTPPEWRIQPGCVMIIVINILFVHHLKFQHLQCKTPSRGPGSNVLS